MNRCTPVHDVLEVYRIQIYTYYPNPQSLCRLSHDLSHECATVPHFIRAAIRKHPSRGVRIGNTVLELTPGDVIRFSVNAGPFADFYGADGWESAEDIAHWADVVADAELCFRAGFREYLSDWRSRTVA